MNKSSTFKPLVLLVLGAEHEVFEVKSFVAMKFGPWIAKFVGALIRRVLKHDISGNL